VAAGGPRRASRDGIGSGARPGAARGKPRASRAKCRTYPGSRRFRRREICQVFFWPTACSALRLLAALRGCLSGPLLSHPAPSPPSTQARLPRHLTHPDPSPPSPAPSSPTRPPPRPPGPLLGHPAPSPPGKKRGAPAGTPPSSIVATLALRVAGRAAWPRRTRRFCSRPGPVPAAESAASGRGVACPGRGVACPSRGVSRPGRGVGLPAAAESAA